ncbi:MAG TPA: glycosyltransferase family 2 protein [Acidimicrobiales bacterium]|nr:glycosyltransferase family 2 protein [Acidimicrobiales bacterium]
MTTTSVIVVSYRPGDWLRPCLESVVGQADEVIVVDNASAGAAASSMAAEAGARAVRSRRNTGFAGGVALGLPEATGDVVAVLNDDAVAGPGWLASAAALLADPGVAAVTPKVRLSGWFREVQLGGEPWYAPGDARPLGRPLRSVTAGGAEVVAACVGAGLHDLETDDSGSRWRWTRPGLPFYVPVEGQDSPVTVDGEPPPPGPTVRVLNHAGSYLRPHGVAAEQGFGAADDGRFDQPGEPFGFSGTAPVFRAETLRRLGAFAVPFFAYNEDTDWCLRARLAGLRIAYDPGAVVTHRLSATSGGTAAVLVRRLAQRNALLCLARNAPPAVARPQIAERLAKWRHDRVARDLARKLPWAVATRLSMSRRWVRDPAEVWAEWVERGSTWDTSPARPQPFPE